MNTVTSWLQQHFLDAIRNDAGEIIHWSRSKTVLRMCNLKPKDSPVRFLEPFLRRDRYFPICAYIIILLINHWHWSTPYCNCTSSLIMCSICHENSACPSFTLKQTCIHNQGRREICNDISGNVYSAHIMHKPDERCELRNAVACLNYGKGVCSTHTKMSACWIGQPWDKDGWKPAKYVWR